MKMQIIKVEKWVINYGGILEEVIDDCISPKRWNTANDFRSTRGKMLFYNIVIFLFLDVNKFSTKRIMFFY